MYPYLLFALIGLFVLILLGGYFSFRALERRRRIMRLMSMRLISIELPQSKSNETNREEIQREINRSSQLLHALANLKMPFSLEVAVSNVGEDIQFYVAVPETVLDFATRQIHGLWPSARVHIAEEYTIFHSGGEVRGAYVKQKKHFILPIRTHIDAGVDTFDAILSSFSHVDTLGEGMALQILIKPAPRSAKEQMTKAVYALRKGETLERVISHSSSGKVSGGLLTKTSSSEKKIVDDEAVKAISAKVNQPLFESHVRLLTNAASAFQAEQLLDTLAGSFMQFSAPLRNEFSVKKIRNVKPFVFNYTMRDFKNGEGMVLGLDELASIFHLPTAATHVPRVRYVHAKDAPPPTELPLSGTSIGESVFRGSRHPVYLTDADRERHLYIIGQTGTGKSTLITHMAVQDIREGKGICLIDPHGDLIQGILGQIPKERVRDVIVFDPGDRERPLGLNMLEFNTAKPEEKTFIVNELFSILDKLYDMKTVGGPMFEQYTKNAILLLMEDVSHEPATLMDIPRVFTDPEYRKRKLARITNPTVIDFWEKEAVKATGEHSLANMAPYITSKFNNFTSNDYVRPIIGQPISSFNFREIMDSKKILLVNLSKGRIGDMNAGLLGMVLVGKILMAALSRTDIENPEERIGFNLYIDEFQNFTTDSIATILSEARKYGLTLTMAHQFIGQLTQKIRDAVVGNVGSIICFRVGADDAEFLEKQYAPVFSKSDLMNISNFHAYVRLLVGGKTMPPFNIETLSHAKGNPVFIDAIKRVSRLRYGRDLKDVEEGILARLRG